MKAASSRQKIVELMSNIKLIVFDFDGVFTDNHVFVFQDGREAVRCCRSDGLGILNLRKTGIMALVLSTEENPVVSARCKKLHLECIQGCGEKLPALKKYCAEKKIELSQVAFAGNDVNDLACLEAVGLPIVVKDAHPDVIPFAKYQTRNKGGKGAVREICDLAMKAHGDE